MMLTWWTRAFARAFCTYFRLQFTDGFVLVTVVVQPLVYALMIAFMLRGLPSTVAAISAVTAGILMSMWVAALYRGTVTINYERQAGTLELLVAAPLPFIIPVLANVTASLTLASSSVVLSYGTVSLASGGFVHIANPLAFLLTFALGLTTFIATGLWLGMLTVLNPEIRSLANGFELLGYLIGAFAVPVTLLPAPVRLASYVFPPYWVSVGLRDAATNDRFQAFAPIWLAIIALSACYATLSLWMLRAVLRQTRQEGTLHAV